VGEGESSWDSRTVGVAAKGPFGGVEEVEGEWGYRTCAPAAEKGPLFEILKWARSKGCDWDVATCAGAAR